MGLMVLSSVIISFGGLIARSMVAADPNQINFYRALALLVTFGTVFVYKHRSRSVENFRKIGISGVFACLLYTSDAADE